jgi:hypothetical protein
MPDPTIERPYGCATWPPLISNVGRRRDPWKRIAIALASLLILASCGKPVPPDKLAYVGEWRERTMYLLITADGSVRYKRLKGGVTTSIKAPLNGFEGNNFVVGVGPMSTTFVVSEPPHEANGTWRMVVDGVTLVRSSE